MTDPRELHEMDQLFAAIREMAALIAAYYKALREEGMGIDEALALTMARQTDMMADPEGETE